jgi:hypothetical protein
MIDLIVVDPRTTPRQWARQLREDGFQFNRVLTQYFESELGRIYTCEFSWSNVNNQFFVVDIPRRYLAQGLCLEAEVAAMDYWSPADEESS